MSARLACGSPIWQRYSVAVGTAAGVGAAFYGRFAAAFFAAFREAFTDAFLAARFLAPVGVSAFFAAWNAAQRFFVASTIAFLPAALSFRFGLVACGATGDEVFLDSAHRFRWASPMRFRAAALMRRLPFRTSGVAAVAVGPPGNMARSSAI